MAIRADKILDNVRFAHEARLPHQRVWFQNTAFFKGLQWWSADKTSGRSITLQQQPEWRKRMVLNYFRAHALIMVAKLTQNRPAWQVVPATLEEEDRDRARLSQYLLDWTWERHECQKKLVNAVQDSVINGPGFWQIYWNPEAGGEAYETDPETNEKRGTVGPAGDLLLDQVSPFDVLLDPMGGSIPNCRFGARKWYASTAWVQRVFAKRVEPEDAAPYSGDGAYHRKSFARLLEGAQAIGGEFERPGLSILEYYDIEAGHLVWLTAGGVVLGASDWTGGLPFVMFPGVRNPGDLDADQPGGNEVWPETIMTDLVPLQIELNILESQTLEVKNKLIYPKMLATHAARVDEMAYTDGPPGCLVPWSGAGGHAPQPLYLGTLPSWIFNIRENLKQSFADLTGVHEVSQGTSPGSLQSGRALMVLAEMDSNRFGPWARNITDALKLAGTRILHLYKKYFVGTRQLQVIGESGALEVMSFHSGLINSTDVRLQEGSTFATNKALLNDQLKSLWDSGILRDDRQLLRLMGWGQLEQVLGNYDADSAKQKREIKRMLDDPSTPVPVDDFDDDPSHLEVLDRFCKTVTYERQSPAARQTILAHRALHQQRYAAIQQQQQQAATQRGVASAGRAEMSMSQGGEAMPGPMQQGLDMQAEGNQAAAMMRMNPGG